MENVTKNTINATTGIEGRIKGVYDNAFQKFYLLKGRIFYQNFFQIFFFYV